MKTAAIYCRVSTDSQEREGTSLETQSQQALAKAKSLGWHVPPEYLIKEDWTGKDLHRPGLTRVFELARTRAISGLIIFTLDRLYRPENPGDEWRVFEVLQRLQDHEITVEWVNTSISKDNPFSGVMMFLDSWRAGEERRQIIERTMRGKKARLAEGKLPQGTGVGMYGYSWNKETKRRETNYIEAEVVREIFNKVARGQSLISIARELNNRSIPTKGAKFNSAKRKLWHSLTIRRMVHNSGYIGNTYFMDTLLPDVTPAIVSEGVFHAANAEIDKPKVRTGRPKHDYLLRNHAFCAICGKPLVGHCLNKKYRYYQCSSARPYENSKQICRARYIRADDLEHTTWEHTREAVNNPDTILAEIQKQLTEASGQESLQSIDSEITELQNNLSRYEQRRKNLLEAMELGEFGKDEVLDRLNNLRHLRHGDEMKLNDMLKIRDNMAGLTNAKIKLDQLYDRVLENLQDCTPDLKRQLIEALDIKVYASTDTVEIRGVIPLELPTTAQTSA